MIYKMQGFEFKQKNYLFFAVFFLILTALIFLPMVAEAKAKSKAKQKDNPKYAAFVMDVETGAILHQESASKLVHPASLTKMMTLLMLFDAMERGKVRLQDRIAISKHAASMPPSKLGLKPGSTIKVEDAIYALVTKSANDIAAAVGEHLGKTESNFAVMMTRRAQELGMQNTTFKNASGLHNPRQLTSARDMGRLGYILVTDYKKYYPYFSTKNFTYRGVSYHNHNRLMESYKGMDGLKTGYIGPSGFNLVASAVRGNHRLVGVVFGGRTAQSRNARMKAILDEGFKKLSGGEMIMAEAEVDTRPVPVPNRKPAGVLEVATLQSVPTVEAPKTRIEQETVLQHSGIEIIEQPNQTSRWALLEQNGENSMFSRMMGEGDIDGDVRARLQTGLIAIAAHTGEDIPAQVWAGRSEEAVIQQAAVVSFPAAPAVERNQAQPASFSSSNDAEWSIQVGAFTNRDRTDKALSDSLKKLPQNLRSAKSVVAPVQTEQGWIFRARINGYSKEAAAQACSILGDCIAIAPNGR